MTCEIIIRFLSRIHTAFKGWLKIFGLLFSGRAKLILNSFKIDFLALVVRELFVITILQIQLLIDPWRCIAFIKLQIRNFLKFLMHGISFHLLLVCLFLLIFFLGEREMFFCFSVFFADIVSNYKQNQKADYYSENS